MVELPITFTKQYKANSQCFSITNKSNIYNVYKYKFIKIENCGKKLLHKVRWHG